MKYLTLNSCMMVLALNGCASMNDSLLLGAGIGAGAGGAASAIGHSAAGHSPSFENIALGAGIGMAVGLVTSYFTHKSVEANRSDSAKDDFEMHFGDLPPSPFIVPKQTQKKGAR